MSDDDYKLPDLPSDEELGISEEDLEHLPDDDGPELSEEEMRALLGEVPKPKPPPASKKTGKAPKKKGAPPPLTSEEAARAVGGVPKEEKKSRRWGFGRKNKEAGEPKRVAAPQPAGAARPDEAPAPRGAVPPKGAGQAAAPPTAATPKKPRESKPAAPSRWRGPAMLAVLVLVGFLSSSYRTLPSPVGTDAPADAFSSGRAMAHLRQIARAPHMIGSPEHARVRGYLVERLRDLGLEPTVETATSTVGFGTVLRAATVRNIVARIPGTASTGTVLLTAHYDAIGVSHGAGDDGTGVVSILETVRALRSGPPLRNDLVVLITDAEEIGLMGARAFVRDSPLMDDVRLVLSVEMRGGGGPSIMFETGVENGWIVRQMDASGIRPTTNSIGFEVYKRLPNDTDFTPFREAGKQGLNFAGVGRASVYHQAYDAPDNLQEATLQHHGENLLGVTRHLGAADLSSVDAPDAVYFSVPLLGVITYDASLVLPITLGVLVLAALLLVGVRRASGTWSGILIGLGSAIVTVAASAGAGFVLARQVRPFHPEYGSLQAGAFHHEGWYVLALVAFALAITTVLFGVGRRWRSAGALVLGALLLPLGLATWLAFVAPMAAMNLQWPVAAGLLGLGALLLPATSRTVVPVWIWTALLAVPVLVILFPVAELLWIGLGLDMAMVIGGLIGLGMLPLLPALDRLREPNAWWAPVTALAVGAVFVALGVRAAEPTADRPAPAALAFALDRGTGEAIWITDDSDEPVDAAARAWVESVAGAPFTETRSVTRFGIGTPRGGEARVAPAPAMQPPAPSLWIMMDTVFAGDRLMRLGIRSNLGAEVLQFRLPDGSPAEVTAVNHVPVQADEPPRLIQHFGVPDRAVVLDLTLPIGVDPDLTVIEVLYHTEALLGPDRFRRPPTLAPDIRWASDQARLLGTLDDLQLEEGTEPPPLPVGGAPTVPSMAVTPDPDVADSAAAAPDSTAAPADTVGVAAPDTSVTPPDTSAAAPDTTSGRSPW